jgi:hypothetical protein
MVRRGNDECSEEVNRNKKGREYEDEEGERKG